MKKTIFIIVLVMVLCSMSTFAQDNWWNKINGCRMYYLQIDPNTFADIEADLDNLYNKGYRIISFFCVYDGDPNAFCGLGPYDFYSVQSTAGTMQDFESLAAAAHAKGMRLMSWINLGYSNPDHPYWIKAQQDKRDGINSKEVNSFRWSTTKQESGDFGWAYSSIAGYYYKKSWGYPAFNWASSDWQNEAQAILEFWHSKGIDGWVFDAAEFLEDENHATQRILKTYVGDVCTSANVIVIPEGSTSTPQWSQKRNFTHCYDNNGDTASHDWTNVAWDAIRVKNPNSIESHLISKTDVCRANGGGTFSYDPEEGTDSRRPLEVAVMISVGILYEMWFSCRTGYGNYTDDMEDVLKAVNSTSALEPGGSRLELSNNQSSVYSITKTSMDGTQMALCVFNFASSSKTVTIDLAGSISIGQYPVDLITGLDGPKITSNSYTVTLPPYGFLLLGVEGSGNNPPTVRITSPTSGVTYNESEDITINADASDSDGSIIKVEFYNGSTKLGEDTTSPYSFTWTNVSPGLYTSLTAKAIDNGNASATSLPVWIMVTGSREGEIVWHSYDVEFSSGYLQAIVMDQNRETLTTLEFYESTAEDSVDQESLFVVFNPGPHREAFNHAEDCWALCSGMEAYPYAGKSLVDRGEDTRESNVPDPPGVRDLQLHPPEENTLTVAAFIVPFNGSYSISNLAVRRVDSEGKKVTYKVFDASKKLIASLKASNNQAWVIDENTYDIGNLTAGDRIYFAVDKGKNDYFYWDAAEVIWTVKKK